MVNINYKTWLSALKIIPGGNMLISKRPPDSLVKKYPIYFSKCDGSYIWDLNGKKYLDMFLMGVGTNILGYNNKEVNRAVRKVIKTGNISSLNSIEDYKLAKELLKINKELSNLRKGDVNVSFSATESLKEIYGIRSRNS